MVKVPEEALCGDQGEDRVTEYRWNSRVARHYFCNRCGIYVFHRKRAAPDHYGVNVRCLESIDMASIPVRATAGIDMTVIDKDAPEHWPGPRAGKGD